MRNPFASQFRPLAARRFGRAQGGNVAVLFALVLPLVIGSAGFGIETTYWYYKRLEMQAAADSAAHAGALEKQAGSTAPTTVEVATATAVENGYVPGAGTIVVNTPPVSGPSAGKQAVEVLITFRAQRFFTSIFQDGEVLIATRAVATWQAAGKACILALDTTEGRAAFFQGSSSLTLTGCSVMSNSVASNALETSGASTLTAECLIAVGGIESDEPGCKIPYAPPAADPYADVPTPPMPATCNGNKEFDPAKRFCSGMKLDKDTTLAPGVYYVTGGDFEVGPNVTVTGTGVTIYLANGAGVKLNNNHILNISAPTSGAYSGVVMYGARNSTGTVKFNGGAGSHLTGAVYFPSRDIDWQGNHEGNGGCMHVVGNTVTWTGNATINVDCTAYGMKQIPVGGQVKLSE